MEYCLLGNIVTMIRLQNLVVGYQGVPLLKKPISGIFGSGSLTALIGENGVGKSTLLKTICGILPPIGGEVQFSSDSVKKSISWLPQRTDIDCSFPISVFDVVAMGCWPKSAVYSPLKDEDIERIFLALKRVRIASLADRALDRLSSGQIQRMLFARLLVQNTDIMVMDEPFTGTDNQTQDELIRLVVELNRSGRTVITVLHNLEIVARFFPDTLVITSHYSNWGSTSTVLELGPFDRRQSDSKL